MDSEKEWPQSCWYFVGCRRNHSIWSKRWSDCDIRCPDGLVSWWPCVQTWAWCKQWIEWSQPVQWKRQWVWSRNQVSPLSSCPKNSYPRVDSLVDCVQFWKSEWTRALLVTIIRWNERGIPVLQSIPFTYSCKREDSVSFCMFPYGTTASVMQCYSHEFSTLPFNPLSHTLPFNPLSHTLPFNPLSCFRSNANVNGF